MLRKLGFREATDNHIPLSGRRFMILIAVVPTLIFYMVWLFIPMVYSIVMSFHDWNPLAKEQPFIGFGNYLEALYKDPVFGLTVRNTFYYMLIVVPIGAALALLIAVMINSLPRFVAFFRVVYFLPVVTSVVAISVMWQWLYQGRFGLINQLLKLVLVDTLGLQINPSIQWLTSKDLAMPSVIAMSVWQGVGFTMVIFLAGLTSIPAVYYEAAKIDGASSWRRFLHITVPLLRPTMIFVLITGVIGSMQVFTPMYIMTEGGPVNSTKTMVFHLFDKAFSTYRFGYASSLAVILFIIILAFTLVQFRFLRTRWQY